MPQHVFPVLRILDYEQALSFYCSGLGFTIDWEWRHEPGFPVFMSISRDAVSLYLSEHTGDCEPGALVYIDLPDVDLWVREMEGRGPSPQNPLGDQPWGRRETTYLDPFGNRLTFSNGLR